MSGACRLPAAAILAAAVLTVANCASNEPLPPSAAAAAVEETRAAAGLPPREPGAAPEDPAVEAARAADAASGSPAPADAPAAEPAEDEPAEKARLGSAKTVTIEPKGGIGAEPKTLGEAAAAARERRGDEPRATIVITNDNLAAFAAAGQVTLVPAEPGAAGEPTAADAETAGAEGAIEPPAAASPSEPGARPVVETPPRGPAGPRDEAYWRERARGTRGRWAAAAEEVEKLEKEADELRWAFYAEDDGYYRDERIKPQWDRVLDELRRARQDVRAFRREVDELMEEGRRAGALPGWLREGIELEPEEREPVEREPRSAEPIEPPQAGAGREP